MSSKERESEYAMRIADALKVARGIGVDIEARGGFSLAWEDVTERPAERGALWSPVANLHTLSNGTLIEVAIRVDLRSWEAAESARETMQALRESLTDPRD